MLIILQEILFVLTVIAPVIAGGVIARQLYRRHRQFDVMGMLAAGGLLFVFIEFARPLSIGVTWEHVGIATALGASVVYATIPKGPRKGLKLILLWIIGLGCSIAIAFILVGQGHYRDNARTSVYRVLREAVVIRIITAVHTAAPSSSYSAGPITADAAMLACLPDDERTALLQSLEKDGRHYSVVRRWHTPITGLYRVERSPATLWYTGGKLAPVVDDAVKQFEWRGR